MKKTADKLIGVFALMILLISPVFAQNIQVQLNGAPLNLGTVPPTNVNGRVLVPLRGVFEALGAQVDYQAATRTVLATKNNILLRLQIGSVTAYVNGKPVILEVPAQIISGRTLVPLRFVSESMDAQVAWNPTKQTVSIIRVQNQTAPAHPVDAKDVPHIYLVKQTAVYPLNAGAILQVTVRGTPGLQGSFGLSQDITNLPLHEDNPGIYTGSYRVRPGDDIYEGYVTARLVFPNGAAISQQSREPFTIDTETPSVISTRPDNGSIININQPNILINVNDQGGSGLAPTTLTIRNEGKTYLVDATVAPPQSIRAVVPQELSGLVEVQANVIDNAGNVTPVNFSFTIQTDAGAIKSVHHNAARALAESDALTVDMTAPSGGRASFNLISQNNLNRILVQGIPMVEIEPHHYRGTYNVLGTRDAGVLIVVGRFRDINGEVDVKNATTPIEIVSQRSTK